MPASLRFLLFLVALSVAVAIASGAALYAENRQRTRVVAEAPTGGNVTAGKQAIARYGCGGCHTIGGVSGAAGKVGPALSGEAVRAHIAGYLPNDPASMERWLQHPQAVAPGNGMPDQGVTPQDARDMAAYLYTLRK